MFVRIFFLNFSFFHTVLNDKVEFTEIVAMWKLVPWYRFHDFFALVPWNQLPILQKLYFKSIWRIFYKATSVSKIQYFTILVQIFCQSTYVTCLQNNFTTYIIEHGMESTEIYFSHRKNFSNLFCKTVSRNFSQ